MNAARCVWGEMFFFRVDFPLIVLFIFPFFKRYRGFWINGFLENEFVLAVGKSWESFTGIFRFTVFRLHYDLRF